MTSIIRLEVISGGQDESPPCYLLHIDDFTFLLDCGWTDKHDMDIINRLEKNIAKINAVLLSQPDIAHLGALPYIVGKLGLRVPIFATVPVFKMGQMFMYDAYLNHDYVEDFQLYNLDDVDAAFDRIKPIEYNHTLHLKGKGHGISVTAYQAGHMTGGTLWKISKTGEEDIYYCIEHNIRKERHLNGLDLEKLKRPGTLITNSINATYVQQKRRKRDELLISLCSSTVRNGGNVLIATDTAGRALELILMLDQMWKQKGASLTQYTLVFMNNVAFNVMEFAKSLLSWMSEKLIKTFENGKTHPFQLKNVRLCHTLAELVEITTPKVVVTSSQDLEYGFSRDLFLQWCQDKNNSVILTSRAAPGTLTRWLIDDSTPNKVLDLQVRKKIRMSGSDNQDCNGGRKKKDSYRSTNGIEEIDMNDDTSNSSCDLKIVETTEKLNNGDVLQPIYGKRPRYDDYGEIDESPLNSCGVGARRERTISQSSGSSYSSTNLNSSRKRSHRSSTSNENEAPSKLNHYTQKFSIRCKVEFIDFEGRSDIESILNWIEQIQPKRLILVRGSEKSVSSFATLCKRIVPGAQIFCPTVDNESVIDNDDGRVLQVKIQDTLMKSLQFVKLRHLQLAWMEGSLMWRPNTRELPMINASENKTNHLSELQKGRALIPKKLKLPDVKKMLMERNIESIIKDGVLRVERPTGVVSVFRCGENKDFSIQCEGLCDEYYEIRKLLYDNFAFL